MSALRCARSRPHVPGEHRRRRHRGSGLHGRDQPRLTFYSLLPLPFVSFTVWFFGERIHRRFEAIQAHFAVISAKVQENLSGVRVVRSFAREEREVEEFAELNREYRRQNMRLIDIMESFHPSLTFLSGLAALLALWLGGHEVLKGRITLGQFVAFTVYLAMLNWPMVALGWVVNLWQRGLASFRRIDQILSTEPEIESASPLAPDFCRGAIDSPAGFTIPARTARRCARVIGIPGATVALVGRTSCSRARSHRRGCSILRPARCSSMARTCGATSWAGCAPTSRSCRRRRSSSRPRSRRT
jgi:ABC-type multidrug transport system fused ATPase/permease subunit